MEKFFSGKLIAKKMYNGSFIFFSSFANYFNVSTYQFNQSSRKIELVSIYSSQHKEDAKRCFDTNDEKE